MPRERSTSFSLEAPEFLFSVSSVKKYTPGNAQELELIEGELLHVIEDKDLFYLCFQPSTNKRGFVPKNYTKVLKPLAVVTGVVKVDYVANEGEIQLEEGDKVIITARINDNQVFGKKMARDSQTGFLRLNALYIEGDIDSLATYEEYLTRCVCLAPSTSIESTRGISNSKPISDKDEKILEKLTKTRARSSSFKAIQQFIAQPKY